MKKVKIILLAAVIFIFSMCGISKADNITVKGNQEDNAIITDINGKDVTNNNDLNEWKQYTISYHITLNSNNYSNGDTFNVYLPSNVQVKNNFTLPVNSPDGNQIAIYSMNKGANYGAVTVTNADWLNQHPLSDFINITFSVYGTEDNPNDGTWKINKVCWFAQDGGVMWNIAVNNVSGKDNKLVITDQPSSQQTLKGNTVQVQYGYYDNNGNFVVQRQGTLPINKTSDGFSVDLGTYSEKNAQITYETIPDKGYQGYLTNKCQLVENGKVVADNSAEIDYNGSANGGGSFKPSSSSSLTNSSSIKKSSIISSMNKSSLSNSFSNKVSSISSSLIKSSKEDSSKVTISSLSSSKDSSRIVLSSSSKLKSSNNTIKSSSTISDLSSSKISESPNIKSFSSNTLNTKSSSIKKKSISSNSSTLQATTSSNSNSKSSYLSDKNNSLNSNSGCPVSNSTINKVNTKSNSLTKDSSSTALKLPNTGEQDEILGMYIMLGIEALLIIVAFFIY